MGNLNSNEELPAYTDHPDLLYKLPSDPETWPRFKAALENQPKTLDEICVLLNSFADLHPDCGKRHRSLLSFTAIIPDLFDGDEGKFVDFFTWMCQLALRMPTLFPTASLPLLRTQHTLQFTYTREQAACLMAHGMLGTLPRLWWQCPDTEEKLITGELRIHHISECSGGVGLERMKGLFLYLLAVRDGVVPLDTEVTVERVCSESPPTDAWWQAQTSQLREAEVHTEGMESDGPHAFVDFANRDLMIHEIIPSATQEEVLFSARPDMFPSLLFTERMASNEVVLFHNAAPLIAYSGYGGTFKVTGLDPKYTGPAPAPAPAPSTVLAIDAIVNNNGEEYSFASLVRDLNKCLISYTAFFSRTVVQTTHPTPTATHLLPGPPAPLPAACVSTGLWGCGVFGGTPTLKFLQQLMAVSVCGRSLRFSSYGNALLAGQLRALNQALVAAHVTVGQLYVAIRDSPPAARQASQIGVYLARQLTGRVPATMEDIAEEQEE